MKMALKDTPDMPFRVPAGIKLISVDSTAGMRSNGPGSILEAFKPGTAPPDFLRRQPIAASGSLSPEVERGVGRGTGGLY